MELGNDEVYLIFYKAASNDIQPVLKKIFDSETLLFKLISFNHFNSGLLCGLLMALLKANRQAAIADVLRNPAFNKMEPAEIRSLLKFTATLAPSLIVNQVSSLMRELLNWRRGEAPQIGSWHSSDGRVRRVVWQKSTS